MDRRPLNRLRQRADSETRDERDRFITPVSVAESHAPGAGPPNNAGVRPLRGDAFSIPPASTRFPVR
jgi:hypothetical protein